MSTDRDGISGDVHVDPDTSRRAVAAVIKRLFPDKKVAGHSGRKSACLNACLLNVNDADLMEAMRIKSLKTLARYTEDCRTIKNQLEAQNIPYKHIIDQWR